jgi:hypothetical protein
VETRESVSVSVSVSPSSHMGNIGRGNGEHVFSFVMENVSHNVVIHQTLWWTPNLFYVTK